MTARVANTKNDFLFSKPLAEINLDSGDQQIFAINYELLYVIRKTTVK